MIFQWNGKEFVEKERVNIKNGDFRRIKTIIDNNADIIQERWESFFEEKY